MDIPEENKQTTCDIVCALNIPKSSLGQLVKYDAIKHTFGNAKPYLNKINKTKRMAFALEHIDKNGVFHQMYDHVHIDEKWFYMFPTRRGIYFHPKKTSAGEVPQ